MGRIAFNRLRTNPLLRASGEGAIAASLQQNYGVVNAQKGCPCCFSGVSQRHRCPFEADANRNFAVIFPAL